MTHFPKIDVHYHPGYSPYLNAGNWRSDLLRNLDQFQIVCAVLSHSRTIVSDSRQGNREVVELCAWDPRLRAYLYLNPYDVPGTLEDLRRYGDNPHVVGVKTRGVFHGLRIDAPEYAPLLEEAARRRLTLLYHGYDPSDRGSALKVMEKFPDWKLIWTHANVSSARDCRSNPRIYFDIASSSGDRARFNIEEMVRLVGEDRLLFGSDAPLISPAWGMGKFDSTDLTTPQRKKIYYDNARKAFPRLKL